MDYQFFISSLENSVLKIEQLVQSISDSQARWKPAPEKWSVLEVINHLYDEECKDFRMRFDLTLHHPEQNWPGIDPEGWVAQYKYNERDFQTSLQNFKTERQTSLHWLRTLRQPKLAQSYDHPLIGKLTAGDILAAWAAHDFLHIRQLANLEVQYLNRMADPFSIRYASP